MRIKAAIVDGPITPELRTRLESMGFEIVDMNDREAMKDLRRRLEIEAAMQKVHDAIGMRMVDVRQEMRQVEASLPAEHVTMPMILKALHIDPVHDIRIDKTKDRFSFADRFVGRGRGPRR